MESNSVVKSIKQKIEELMDITKCRNCGCMRGALETVKGQFSQSTGTYPSELLIIVENSLERLEPMEYT